MRTKAGGSNEYQYVLMPPIISNAKNAITCSQSRLILRFTALSAAQ
jgi:hypothetical protein